MTATAAEDDDHADERVSISHSASGGDYSDVAAELVATTVDDDEPAIVLVGAPTAVQEGTTRTYEVRLDTEPAGTVRVQATASGDVEVDMDPTQAGRQLWLRFDSTNWNTARTVVVRVLQDDDAGNDMATIRHVASGADYGRAPAAEIAFAVNDDDLPGLGTYTDEARTVYEGSSWEYSVVLSTLPIGGPVQVAVTSSDELVATVSPATLTFDASDWNVHRTMRVQGVNGGMVTLAHTASGADYDGETDDVSVTVLDSDTPGVRVEPLVLLVYEGGAASSYRIRLNTQPSGNVSVTPSAGAFAPELSVAGDGVALIFTTTDWNQDRTVSVEAGDDGDAELEEYARDSLRVGLRGGVVGAVAEGRLCGTTSRRG